jgi:hypothetical protein
VDLFVWGMVVRLLEMVAGFKDAVLGLAGVESIGELEGVLVGKGAIEAMTKIVLPALNSIQSRPNENLLFCLDSLDAATLGGGIENNLSIPTLMNDGMVMDMWLWAMTSAEARR